MSEDEIGYNVMIACLSLLKLGYQIAKHASDDPIIEL